MTELLPCPFCGGRQTYRKHDGAVWLTRTNHKRDCIMREALSSVAFVTEAEAIAAWNMRAERTCRCTTDDNAWCFACSECGKSFPRSKLHLAHNHGEINYCPNCGAKVIGGDAE